MGTPGTLEQEALWVLTRLDPEGSAYHVPGVFHVRGPLDVAALEQAVDEVVRRHESLRGVLDGTDDRPLFRVGAHVRAALPCVSIEGLPEDRRERAFARLSRREAGKRFDLRRGPIVRARAIRWAEQRHTLLLTFHHIAFDWWSLQVFAGEVAALYSAYRAGLPSPLAEPAVGWSDVVRAQRERLSRGGFEPGLEYWQRALKGAPPLIELPADRPRGATFAAPAGEVEIVVPLDLVSALETLGRRHRCTFATTLHAASVVLIHRYTGQDDFCIGVPFAQRTDGRVHDLIGYLVNTLPVRHDVAGDPTFVELLGRVRAAIDEAQARSDVPFSLIVDRLRAVRDAGHLPLFQAVVGVQPGGGTSVDVAGVRIEAARIPPGTAKFDLMLELSRRHDGLAIRFEYNARLFDAATIARMAGHFERLLHEIVARPQSRVSALPLGAADTADATAAADAGLPDDTLAALVWRTAATKPDAVAVMVPEAGHVAAMTYGDMWRRARLAAEKLRARGVGPERTVGVCLDASLAKPVALLAILEAGGAYVPLDPRWPSERLAFVLRDADVGFVVIDPKYLAQFQRAGARCVVWTDLERDATSPTDDPSRRDVRVTPAAQSNVAYVLYTSGSTGTPKGTAIQHRSVVAFIDWATRYFRGGELACVYAATPLCFDLSVFELFATLCAGGTVVLADSVLHLPSDAPLALPTLVNTVPSFADALVRSYGVPASVVTVALAGEALHRRTVDALFDFPSVRRVVNLYGPTETTTYSTVATLERSTEGIPPIGAAIDRTFVQVCDKALRPVTRGLVGELCIGGAGVARGYVNRPDLTAGQFVPDPFAAVPGSRLYRTGDLARYAADGTLRYLGRRDHQVKLRGYRIDLGEVEARLQACGGVRAAAAVTVGAGADSRLVAYVVGDDGPGDESRLRHELRERLPGYMLPDEIVWLDALPRTATGKTDRLALPLPRPRTGTPTGPVGDIERALEEIWREVLGCGPIDVERGFFEAGGNSLLLFQVAAAIDKRLGRGVTAAELFRHPTIRALAHRLSSPAAPAAPDTGAAPVSRAGRYTQHLGGAMREVHERRRAHG